MASSADCPDPSQMRPGLEWSSSEEVDNAPDCCNVGGNSDETEGPNLAFETLQVLSYEGLGGYDESPVYEDLHQPNIVDEAGTELSWANLPSSELTSAALSVQPNTDGDTQAQSSLESVPSSDQANTLATDGNSPPTSPLNAGSLSANLVAAEAVIRRAFKSLEGYEASTATVEDRGMFRTLGTIRDIFEANAQTLGGPLTSLRSIVNSWQGHAAKALGNKGIVLEGDSSRISGSQQACLLKLAEALYSNKRKASKELVEPNNADDSKKASSPSKKAKLFHEQPVQQQCQSLSPSPRPRTRRHQSPAKISPQWPFHEQQSSTSPPRPQPGSRQSLSAPPTPQSSQQAQYQVPRVPAPQHRKEDEPWIHALNDQPQNSDQEPQLTIYSPQEATPISQTLQQPQTSNRGQQQCYQRSATFENQLHSPQYPSSYHEQQQYMYQPSGTFGTQPLSQPYCDSYHEQQQYMYQPSATFGNQPLSQPYCDSYHEQQQQSYEPTAMLSTQYLPQPLQNLRHQQPLQSYLPQGTTTASPVLQQLGYLYHQTELPPYEPQGKTTIAQISLQRQKPHSRPQTYSSHQSRPASDNRQFSQTPQGPQQAQYIPPPTPLHHGSGGSCAHSSADQPLQLSFSDPHHTGKRATLTEDEGDDDETYGDLDGEDEENKKDARELPDENGVGTRKLKDGDWTLQEVERLQEVIRKVDAEAKGSMADFWIFVSQQFNLAEKPREAEDKARRTRLGLKDRKDRTNIGCRNIWKRWRGHPKYPHLVCDPRRRNNPSRPVQRKPGTEPTGQAPQPPPPSSTPANPGIPYDYGQYQYSFTSAQQYASPYAQIAPQSALPPPTGQAEHGSDIEHGHTGVPPETWW